MNRVLKENAEKQNVSYNLELIAQAAGININRAQKISTKK